MIARRLLASSLSSVLVFAATATLSPAAEDVQPPADAFFASSAFLPISLSPDGTRAVTAFTRLGREQLVLIDVASGEARSLVQLPDPGQHIGYVTWANDDRLLLSIEYRFERAIGVRARGTRPFTIKADGSGLKEIGKRWSGYERLQNLATLVHLLPDEPDYVLMSLMSDSAYPSVYRVHVRSGRRRAVVRDRAPIVRWVADHDGVVRVGAGLVEGRTVLFARIREEDAFEALVPRVRTETGVESLPKDFDFVGFDFDPRIIYIASDHEAGRAAVYRYDLEANLLGEKIASHPLVDVSGPLLVDYAARKVTGVRLLVDEPEWVFLDDEARAQMLGLERALDARVNIMSRNRDDRRWLVSASRADMAPAYYLFDREKKELSYVFESLPILSKIEMSEVKPISYETRDDRTIHGYLTLPRNRPEKDLPLVVYPHGGPESRDFLGFRNDVQFLANRGYAVFQMNFRGSSGYGTEHLEAGYHRWGLEMQDDITDGVEWLIGEGIADRDRICIMGGSYGGYAALMGLVKTPNLYRCGVSINGVTDLELLLADDGFYRFFDDLNEIRIGSDAERLAATSPLQNVERIVAPVLLAHGDADQRVHVKHAEKLSRALEKLGKPHELLVLEDETHQLERAETRLAFFRKLEEFLAEHLSSEAPPPSSVSAPGPEAE